MTTEMGHDNEQKRIADGWTILHFQSQAIYSLPISNRVTELLQYHLHERNEKVLLVCSSGESDLNTLDELINESYLQKSTNQTVNISMHDRKHVSLSWGSEEQQNSLLNNGEDDISLISDHFVDGFNVWKEYFAQWVDQLFAGEEDFDTILKENEGVNHIFQRVIKLLLGINLIGSVSSKIRAEILSVCSEITSRILALYLCRALGIQVGFIDSSLFIRCSNNCSENYLATLPSQIDFGAKNQLALSNIIESMESSLIIVQGNVVRDENDNFRLFSTDPKFGAECTVICVAKLLNSGLVKFFTSNYGICTCQLPGVSQPIDGAKLINELNFVEALEIAATSDSKFICPLTLKLCQEYDIPIYINSIHYDIRKTDGTFISSRNTDDEYYISQIKSICLRTGIVMISIDTFAMWQQVGFLSDVFSLFKKYKLSVDYVTTSEANITCSLDAITEDKSDENIDRMDRINLLLEDLKSMNCRAVTIGPCASLSLVGRNIRDLLHKLSHVFKIFNNTSSNTNHPIHLISQAQSNVNLSFIVPQMENINVLVTDIHDWLFKGEKNAKLSASIGQEWRTLLTDHNVQAAVQRPASSTINAVSGKNVWWRKRSSELLELIKKEQQPLYVYCADVIKQRAAQLIETLIRDQESEIINFIFFAIKANPHPDILRLIESMKLGFECVSPQEIDLVLSLFPDIDRKRILFTPNFASREDYMHGLNMNVNVTLDNIFPLEKWPEVFENKKIFLRIDSGIGKGHHKKVKTAGLNSKFGIPITDFDKLDCLCTDLKITVIGLHAHVGSGILRDSKAWKETAQFFLDLLMTNQSNFLKKVRILDIGGGLGVPYRPEDQPLDLSQVYQHLHSLVRGTKKYYDFIKQRNIKFWIEPGRFLSAEAGIILARVTQTKKKANDMSYVGLETGMNSLIRPTLYNAYHEIVNLSGMILQKDTETEFPSSNDNEHVIKEKYTVVGPICETGDVLGEDRWMHKCENGHVIVICCAGSYGHSMSSFYNNRPPAKEIFLP